MSNPLHVMHVIMIGPTRTGTTSLFRFMAGEPSVSLSSKKETNFFLPAAFNERVGSVDEYYKYFNRTEETKVYLEASPLYFLGGRKVAEAVMRSGLSPLIIVSLREPVERFVSLFRHVVSKRNVGDRMSFSEFMNSTIVFDKNRFKSFDQLNLMSFTEGCYADLIAEWIDVVGHERIKVVFYDHLVDKNYVSQELHSLLEFCGLECSNLLNHEFFHENKSRQVKNTGFHKAALTINDLFEPFLTKNIKLRNTLRNLYYFFNESESTKAIPDDSDVNVLKDIYREKNHDLLKVLTPLGVKDYPNWVNS